MRIPDRIQQATPDGCERIVLRSLREVEAHEKKANVRSEMAWYDTGSGTGSSMTNTVEKNTPNGF